MDGQCGNPARSPNLAIQSPIADDDRALERSTSLPGKPRTDGRQIGVLRDDITKSELDHEATTRTCEAVQSVYR